MLYSLFKSFVNAMHHIISRPIKEKLSSKCPLLKQVSAVNRTQVTFCDLGYFFTSTKFFLECEWYITTSDGSQIDDTTAPVALFPYWAFKDVKLQLGNAGLTTIEDSASLYGLKSYVILMGKLSASVKNGSARLTGFYVDDVGDFDDMDTRKTPKNSGQAIRNTLFKLASAARPVKTLSQINFDISECEKFLPPNVKAMIKMDHTSEELRYKFRLKQIQIVAFVCTY